MSDNVFKKSSFMKNISKIFSKDNNDKGKNIIKFEIGKNCLLILQKFI